MAGQADLSHLHSSHLFQVATLVVQLGSNKNKFWLDDIMHIAIVTYPPMNFVAIQDGSLSSRPLPEFISQL